MAEAKPKAVISTGKHLAASIAEAHSIPKKQAEAIVADVVNGIVQSLTKGEKVRLAGLGTFQVNDRPARQARNPATGAMIDVAASKKAAFRPAKELKEAI
ncbi:HU family DNA-binding protein [Bosea sp. ANAM02]|uniref:HU family DNA-binding protein n=1 Tax=Bosea sp. ANAM02 TaxID=2020412 RepID=UPI00140EDD5D|nr:HU family DNA-binding protein [Bosea sp. ANAM02]BCB22388.1 DNA-binding protein [Bosea sp. ANAM02]